MKRALGKPSHRSGSVVGVSTGATTLRPFTFSKLQLTGMSGCRPIQFFLLPTTDGVTEEEDGLPSKSFADLSHLGTIIVKAHRAKSWSTLPYIDKLRSSPSELPAVSEKSKKAASHCIRLELPSVRIHAYKYSASTSLGVQRTQKLRPRAYGVELLGKSPVATFVFRYASKGESPSQRVFAEV